MTTASFGPRGLEEAADHAQRYRHHPVFGGVPMLWGRLQYLDPLGPGGGIDASIDEMARYALLQLSNGTVSGQRLVSDQMMVELHRPEIAVGADWPGAAGFQDLQYALGWFPATSAAHILSSTMAQIPVFRASIFLVPSAKAGIVILTNGESDAFPATATRTLLEELLG